MAQGFDGGFASTQPAPRKRDFVYETLKRSLILGDYLPGEELVAVELASQFGTSRQPVMDALKQLQSEGFVEVLPQIGVRVIRPEPTGIVDYYRVFGALEGLAAEMAAERRTAEGLNVLRSAIDYASERITENPDLGIAEYLTLNRGVHGAIHALASSSETSRVAQTYWDRSDFLMAAAGRSSTSPWFDHADHEHHAILDAIFSGDRDGARELATNHLVSIGALVAANMAFATPGSESSVAT